MGKRKAQDKPKKVFEDESSSDDDDQEMLDVEFEFFDPNPDVDFQGLKTLLRQLLDVDALQVDLSALADLILKQKLIGSTIKTDGIDSDPWAFLTVLNLKEHKDKPIIQQLLQYLSAQTGKNPRLRQLIPLINSDENEVGLILSARAFGVPTQVIPPMYKMLAEEIGWAIEENEQYKFTHYLIISKTYVEVDSALDREDNQAHKKHKRAAGNVPDVLYFHPEDEIIQKHAVAFGTYPFDNEEAEGQSDARRTFQDTGIKPQGSLILFEAGKYPALMQDLENYVKS